MAEGWTSAIERGLEALQRADDRHAVLRDLATVPVAVHQVEERLALELQRLVVRDLRTEDVAGARQPLAVARRRRLGRLVVDRHLLGELQVGEDEYHRAGDD